MNVLTQVQIKNFVLKGKNGDLNTKGFAQLQSLTDSKLV